MTFGVNYELTCNDDVGDGWPQGYINVRSNATEHTLCNEFDDSQSYILKVNADTHILSITEVISNIDLLKMEINF